MALFDWSAMDEDGRRLLMGDIEAGTSAAVIGLPNETYHKGIGTSSSQLKVLSDWSPKHFKERKPQETTEAMRIGNALHTMVLEPQELLKRYVFAPGIDLRTKKGKEEMEGHRKRAELQGKEVLRYDQREFQPYADAIRSHPVWAKLCGLEAKFELSVFCTDPDTGILVKARSDLANFTSWQMGSRILICDLKSAKDQRLIPFTRQAIDKGYDFSAAMYCAVFEFVFGKPCDFCWCVIPKTGLPAPAIYHFGDKMRQRGTILYRNALKTLKECQETGVWPGLNNNQAPTPVPPAWARLEEEGN